MAPDRRARNIQESVAGPTPTLPRKGEGDSGKQPCVDHYGGSAQDGQRDVLVFFGGYCGDGTVTFNGAAWAALTLSLSPAIPGNEAGRPAMTYDPDHQVVLMFGGVLTGTYYNDTWAWDGAHWTRVG